MLPNLVALTEGTDPPMARAWDHVFLCARGFSLLWYVVLEVRATHRSSVPHAEAPWPQVRGICCARFFCMAITDVKMLHAWSIEVCVYGKETSTDLRTRSTERLWREWKCCLKHHQVDSCSSFRARYWRLCCCIKAGRVQEFRGCILWSMNSGNWPLLPY